VIAREFYSVCREILAGGPLRTDSLVTLYETVAGFALAIVIAFGCGVLIAELPVLRRVLMPYLVAVNAAPKIAFAPLLLVWFGFGMSSKVVMAALIAFFPLLVNVVAGIAGTDPQKLRLMRSLAASGWMTFVKVKLPDAMPVIFAGLKTAIVFSVVGAVVGEFVGADAGLGHVIKQTDYQLDVPLTFALIVLLSLMGILLFYTIELIERRVLFWTSPQQ
jgi:NitT/TauT family transport system permease protein